MLENMNTELEQLIKTLREEQKKLLGHIKQIREWNSLGKTRKIGELCRELID